MYTRKSRIITALFVVLAAALIAVGCSYAGHIVVSSGTVSSSDVSHGVDAPALPNTLNISSLPFSLSEIAGVPAGSKPQLYESGGTVKVLRGGANVRTDAGADYELIASLRVGSSYKVLGQKDAANAVRWFLIDLGDGRQGYVCGNYLSYDGEIVGAKAYLTFDDGPSGNTMRILDILDEYDAKATFFVIYHGGCEEYYREIVRRGHTIALHSWSHDYSVIYKREKAYFDDLERLADYIEDVTGLRPKYVRFPGGASNTSSRKYCHGIMTRLTQAVEERGYQYFDWNISSGDAEGSHIPKDKLVGNVKRELGTNSNAIILMHDTLAKSTTVDALPDIIEYLQSRGYELAAIDDTTYPYHHAVTN